MVSFINGSLDAVHSFRMYKETNMRIDVLRANEKGASLIELLIVTAITIVLVGFAVSQFGNAEASFDTQGIAREFKVNLERARFDSVKRRPGLPANFARVLINSPTSFTVALDLDKDGSIETSDMRVVDITNTGNINFLTDGISLPIMISFDRRGRVAATDSLGNPVNPSFTVCNNCTSTTASRENAYIVSISPTGTVRMYQFGETPDTFANPTVGNISTTADIDPMVTVLPGSGAPVGTPAITPTPDPTTPTPVPTPTPSPTPNSSPTPVVDICLRNERPADSGCVCVSPMSVRSNGQCR